MEETRKIEEELSNLLKEAKNSLARIENIDNFSESVYALIISTLIKIENENKEVYTIKEHSVLEFSLPNIENNSSVYKLIYLHSIENMPSKLDFEEVKNNFENEYLKIIAKYSTTKTDFEFMLSNRDVYKFYTCITMLLNGNKNLCVNINSSAKSRPTFTISLNFENSLS